MSETTYRITMLGMDEALQLEGFGERERTLQMMERLLERITRLEQFVRVAAPVIGLQEEEE